MYESNESKLERIGLDFHKEIEAIKKERLKLGKDKKKRSTKFLSNLIVKHYLWDKIKEEMITLDVKK